MPVDRPDHSIWSLCFAKGRLPRDFVEGSPVASNRGIVQIPMVYSLIVSESSSAGRRVLLVDTGFASGKSMTGRSFDDFEPPETVLAKVGLAPADVDAIILTHLHFDHVGNLDAFPDVPIYLQEAEYRGWRRVFSKHADTGAGKSSWAMSSMNRDDWPKVEAAVAAGRVRFIDGDQEIYPGIIVHLAADGHTFGCQWVEIVTPEGSYVLAGDSIVTYANLERMWPPGYHQGNAWNLLSCYREVMALVGPRGFCRISPGHDMELFRRIPSRVCGANPVAELRAAANRSLLSAGSPLRK